MAGKRSQRRLDLSAPRASPISVHLNATPTTPASALADRIFNDPQSWNRDTPPGTSKDELATWDVIDQFPTVPSGPDSADFLLKPFTNKFRLAVRPDIMSPESELESDSETVYGWEGIKEKTDDMPSIILTLDRPRMDKDKVTQLDRMSVLWSHGNLFRAFPSPLTAASAPTSPVGDVSALGPFQRPLSPHHLAPTPTPRSPFKPLSSPLRSAACSTTWSILEYYDVNFPQTPLTARDSAPRLRASARRSMRVPSHPSVPPPPVPPPPLKKDVPAPAAPTSLNPGLPISTPMRGASIPAARPGVRPLPSIPRQPPPPALSLSPLQTGGRLRANTTTGIRSLPPTPPPKDVRLLTVPHWDAATLSNM
ncbi:hypothetical protein B0H10DRAFT_1985871 [Mycena sp. CBHHK59/15]|nr:hypothetical protein B0H10DRAFT_1985871 [Mycena sp. CBHHK59/15]